MLRTVYTLNATQHMQLLTIATHYTFKNDMSLSNAIKPNTASHRPISEFIRSRCATASK